MIMEVTEWMDEVTGYEFIWYVKRLSGNDTLANGTHQAGPYVPREFFFSIFPSLKRENVHNPDIKFELSIDSHADCREVRAVWYNNKFHDGTRNEIRLTNFGGASSALLDPESTGALTVFAFILNANREAETCRVWVCRHETEEDIVESRIGPVEPGKWKIWPLKETEYPQELQKHRPPCWLMPQDIPAEWLKRFPSALAIIKKAVALHPVHKINPDLRLIKRRDCEFDIFRSIEEAIELPWIKQGFGSIDKFIARAQTILQRRKVRSGLSLELHIKEIFIEEGLKEDEEFSHQPESEQNKKPDFLFPCEAAYKNSSFAEEKLRMLAVKTTCRDRWRQILNEADRIKVKHLFTLQEGISENQFKEMTSKNVQLVVPQAIIECYPKSVQPHLQTLESFIGDIRLLLLS